MGEVELSICIANWNCRDLLRRCLESIQAATTDFRAETIVIDNGSTDGAAEMVERDFPWVVLHRNATNEGFARANNRAAQLSRGRYLLFLNNDTVVEAECPSRLVKYLQANPDVGMVGPKIFGADGRPQKSYRKRPTPGVLLHRLAVLRLLGLYRGAYRRYRRSDYRADETRPVEVLLGAAVCLPRDLFFSVGGWDEHFPFGVEDLDLSMRIGRTHRLIYYPAARLTHFGRAGSRLNGGFAHTGLECGHARYLRKHHFGPVALALYKLLVLLNLPVAMTLQGVRRLLNRWPSRSAARSANELAALWQFASSGLGRFLRS